MVQHYILTMTTGAQSLAKVLPNFNASGAQSGELAWTVLSLQADTANTGAVFVGSSAPTVTPLTTSNWGIFIPIPASSVPAAPIILVNKNGHRLEDWAAISAAATDKLHITVEE